MASKYCSPQCLRNSLLYPLLGTIHSSAETIMSIPIELSIEYQPLTKQTLTISRFQDIF